MPEGLFQNGNRPTVTESKTNPDRTKSSMSNLTAHYNKIQHPLFFYHPLKDDKIMQFLLQHIIHKSSTEF